MTDLASALDEAAGRTAFSGVVRVEHGERIEVDRAYGLRDRAHGLPMETDTQLGLASGAKGFTGLVVLSLVADGRLALGDPVRPVLGEDLPLIDEAVTVEHLLTHTSGIGDYVDETQDLDSSDYLMPVPVHRLAETQDYLVVLDGHPQVSKLGERFTYNNSAFVVLALVCERVAGQPFRVLVEERVCRPAGLADTAFLRSDELPGRAAVGYLGTGSARTNVLHLPVRGSGDGGIYSTAADISSLWRALFDGRILPEAYVCDLVTPRAASEEEELEYGLGMWLHPGTPRAELHGYDAGVSFRSVHDPVTTSTWTVISNTSEGSWPIEEVLDFAIKD
jgi:CubicO group peptidase (beta-lactamase class C family)